MSTDYYLVQTDPTPIYDRAKVAQKSGGNVSLWTDDDIDWVGVDGDMVDAPNVTMPATVADLKVLVASGRYRLMDEYWEEHDVEEVFGE